MTRRQSSTPTRPRAAISVIGHHRGAHWWGRAAGALSDLRSVFRTLPDVGKPNRVQGTPGRKSPDLRILTVSVLLPLALGGCGEPAGTPCQITGDGFHAKDPCRDKCLSRWSLTCPDQQRITPNVCTGAFACQPGGCPEGQLCYHDDDPFDDRSFCVPDNVCGALTPAAASAWERATLARQQDVIRQREQKQSSRELFGRCGLDLSAYELNARFAPPMLSLDIDGDDTLDLAALVTRTRDGRQGLALCRAGTWLEWLGEGHALAANEAVLSTLESLETWRIEPGDRGAFGFVDEPPWPETAGDVLVLERHEKSLVALYWRRGAVRAHVAFRLVEP